MLLQRKINRAMKWSRERKMRTEGRDPEREALEAEVRDRGKGKWKEKDELPTMEELIEEEKKLQLEKGDLPAMIGAAFLTIFPVCVLAVGIICLLVWLFFFR
ncbi:MAG: hypothetical protein IJ375_01310 [Oscillospiraceae bacterium]|nr:hypothetical protein [Oscillospiraceae bacterium]